MSRTWKPAFVLLVALFTLARHDLAAEPIIIGSKKFTESYVLSEIAKRSLANTGVSAEHRQGMGGTIILWEALRTGQISAYPEYTGTVAEEILKMPGVMSPDSMRGELAKSGVGMSAELGFNNTYALVMRRDVAAARGIATISDLRNHPTLRIRPHPRVHRAARWLAAARRAISTSISRSKRDRPRSRLRSAEERLDRREGRVLD
jgi:osmoprotectant transport system permease protein